MKEKTKGKKLWERVVALLLVVAMTLSLTPSGLQIAADTTDGEITTTTKSDTITNTDWQNQMSESSNPSSENVGRIWTDKSVTKENSVTLSYGALAGTTVDKTEGADFLVELSVLSSTSSLTQTTETSQALDIVLVLDVSGSMSDSLTSYTYTETYSVNMNSRTSYYILASDGNYYQVSYSSQTRSWSYTNSSNNRVTVSPMTSADDTTSGNVQFYTRSTSSTTKLAALKTAVNNFVDSVADENDDRAEAEQHKISVVTFAGSSSTPNRSGATVVADWASYTSDTVDTLTGTNGTINKLTASGATFADDALSTALSQIQSTSVSSDGAQKVVIFFTDGEPNHGSGFWPSVATSAVNTAYTIKNTYNALLYSVAVYSGADSADTTTNINAYLNAVSSNYPSATATGGQSSAQTDSNGWASSNLTLGTGSDAGYYLVAEDEEGLTNVFSGILQDITASAASSPTEVEETTEGVKDPSAGGYVTFVDTLGEFMEVKDFNAIVVDELKFTTKSVSNPVASTDETYTTTTYTFTGTVGANAAHEEAGDLTDLIIEVKSYTDPSKGDEVTVKIPATLLPLLYYDIATDEDGITTMGITYDYPLRVFYSVGLKDGVKDAMASGDYDDIDGLAAYVADNTDSTTGTVNFYSNYYNAENKVTENGTTSTYGNTTVSFTPATTNNFYYFQKDREVYTDAACTVRATSIVEGTTYYYLHEYYVNITTTVEDELTGVSSEMTTAAYTTKAISFVASSDNSKYLAEDTDGVYIKAGSPRISLGEADEFMGAKSGSGNATGTADYYIYPTWTGGNNAVTYLGNNGLISFTATGSLSISKTVSAAANLTPDPDAEFTFQVTLTTSSGTALSGTYNYSVVDSATGSAVLNNGVAVTGTISTGGTLTLKDGQTAVITGLPATTEYKVAELTDTGYLPGGYAASDISSTGNTGTIGAAATSTAAFTNTYKVSELEVDTSAKASASKTLTGRDWTADDSFVFYLVQVGGTTVLPTVGSIAYTDSNVKVTAAEIGYGTTGGGTVTAMRIEVAAAAGTTAGTAVDFGLGTYTFAEPGTYTYRLLEYDSGVSGITYSDATYTLEIVVTDNGDGTLSAAYTLTQDTTDDGTSSNTVVATDQASGTAAFTNTYDPSTQSVELEAYKSLNGSAAPRGAFSFTFTALDGAPVPEGVTGTSWTVSSGDAGSIRSGHISVEADDFEGAAENTLVYSYEVVEVQGTATGVTYDKSVYKYEYTFTYTEKTDEKDAEISYTRKIYKKNDSGEWDEVDNTGEAFTEVAFSNSSTVTIGDDTNAGIQVTKSLEGRSWTTDDSYEFTLTAGTNTAGVETPMPSGTSGNKLTIIAGTTSSTDAFGEITYSAAGVYYYTITETNGGQTINGVTYDDSEITVIVTVTQQPDGSLKASVAYGSVESSAASAAFTNTYDAEDVSTTSTTFAVSKTLSGRDWLSTDAFYFDIEAEDDEPLPLNTRIAAEADSTSPSFEYTVTYTEAGTYVYYITEESDASVAISGVTYSNAVYKVVVTVTDNYEGKLVMDVAYYKGTVANDGSYGNFSTTAESEDIAAFTNTYDAEPVSDRYVGGAKYLVGYDMADGEEFIFTLTPTGDTKTAIENGTVVVTPDTGYEKTSDSAYASYYTGDVVSVTSVSGMTDDSYKGFTFGTITYSKAGTYTFKVNEVANTITDTDAGIKYDTHTTYVQVVVTDDGSGQLAVTSVSYMDSTYENVTNDWTFTNMVVENSKDVYATDSDGLAVADSSGNAVSIDGTLVEVDDVLTYSIDWTNDYYNNGAAAAATVVITDEIPQYTEIVADSISDNGVYDSSTRTITWTINAAAAATGTVSFQVKVVGDDSAGESLSITNEATVKTTINDVEQTSHPTNKTTNYTPVTVSNAFQVQKVIVDKEGNAIADSNTETNVWDSVDGTNYWFRFVLEAYEVDADGVAKSDVLPAATATDSSTANMGQTTSITTAEGNPGLAMNVDDSAVYDFGSVTYTEPGTYYYDVWERSAITAVGTSGAAVTGEPLPGVSYSGIRYRIKVTVTEGTDANGDTILEASYVIEYVKDNNGETPSDVTYTSSSDANVKNMVITNVYDEDSESVRFLGAKVYNDTAGGKDITQGAFEFKYTVITSGAPVPSSHAVTTHTDTDGNVYWTVTNDGDGDFSSYPITFTLANGEKETYYYTVEEVLPTDDDLVTDGIQKDGVTYDDSVYYIKVVADYTGDVLVVNYYYGTWDDAENSFVELDSDSSALSELGRILFTNTYNAEGTLEGKYFLQVSKTLTGRAGGSNETFTFQIVDAGNNVTGLDANPMPEDNKSTDSSGNTIYTIEVSAPSTDGGTTTDAFADITYTRAGTYTYTISEVKGDNEITTWSDAVYTVVVTVEDTGDGTLNPIVTSFTLTGGSGTEEFDGTAAFENIYEKPEQTKEVYAVDANNVTTEVNGQLVGVGSILTYKINWVNTAIDEDGDSASATIVVTDTVPSGTAYVTGTASEENCVIYTVNGGTVTDLDAAGITLTIEDDGVDTNGNTVITWTFTGVPANAYGTVLFEVKVTEEALKYDGVSNTAKITIGEDNSAVTSETNPTVNPMPEKDVTLADSTESADGKQVGVGDELTYTVSWQNTAKDVDGNSASATIQIYDVIPAGTVIVPGSVTAPTGARVQYIVNLTTGGYVWNVTEANKSEILAIRWIFTADAEDSGEVSFKVTVTEDAVEQTGNEITNQAGVKVGDNAYAYTNETSNYMPKKDVYAADAYDAGTAESIDGQMVGLGERLTYTIDWVNTTGVDDTVITIKDTIPTGTDYVTGSASEGTNSEAVVEASYANGVITWTITAAAGASGTVSFDVEVTEDAFTISDATITNEAALEIGGNTYTTNETTNTVPVKTSNYDSDSNTLKPGEEFSYTIRFTNTTEPAADGEDPVTLVVTDTLVDGLTYNSKYTVKVTLNGTEQTTKYETFAQDAQKLTWTFSNLPAGAQVEITFDVKVDDDAPSSVVNQAYVGGHATNYSITPVPADDEKHVLENGKLVDDELVSVGDVLTYEISWTNAVRDEQGDIVANEYADKVTIVDNIPNGVEVDESSITSGGVYDADADTITWEFTITGTTEITRGVVWFNATVTGGETEIENAAVINDYTVTATVYTPKKSVSLVSDDSQSASTSGYQDVTEAEVGQKVEFTISFTATADVLDNGSVTVKDTLLTGLEYVTGSANITIDGNAYDDGDVADTDDSAPAVDGQNLTWTLKNVKEGSEVVITFQAEMTRDAASTVENQATVAGHKSNVVTVIAPSDPAKHSKDSDGITVDGEMVSVGDTLTYEIDWTNEIYDEFGEATGKYGSTVTITDAIPEGVEVIESTISNAADITYDTEDQTRITQITWKIENLSTEDMERGTVSYDVEVVGFEDGDSDGTITNTAYIISGLGAYSVDVDNYVPVKTVALPEGNDDTVAIGQELTYTITFHNTDGADAAATVRDTLSDGLSFVTDSDAVTVQVNGSAVTYDSTNVALDEDTLTWTLTKLPENADVTITFKATVTMDALSEVTNTVTVNNKYTSNTTSTTVEDKTEKDVVNAGSDSIDGQDVAVGDVLTYEIYWTNTSGEEATVTVTDTVPTGTVYTDASGSYTSSITGAEYSYDSATGLLTWIFKEVPSGTHGKITFDVTVDESAEGTTVENTAYILIGEDAPASEAKPTNTTKNDVPDEPEAPVKSVSESSAAGSELVEITEDGEFVYGSVGIYDRITYEIDYYNHHNATATVEVVDKLDSGVDFISATGVEKSKATDADLVVYEYDESTHTVTWTIIEEAFTGGSVQVVVEVNEDAKLIASTETVATVENQATVVVTADTSHEATTNVVVNTVDPDQPASPSKTVVSDTGADGEVSIGDTVTYEITYYNNLNETADITITDNLDDGVDFVSVGEGENGTYNEDTNTVTWIIKDVAPFTGGAVTLNVEVNEDARVLEDGETQASITNTAYVTVGNDADTDPQPTNTTENPLADDDPEAPVKSIVTQGISEDDVLEAGDELTYEITWYNNQNATVDVVITDELDDGVDFVSIDNGIGAYDEETHTITWTIADAAPFEGGSVTLTVKVNESAQTPDDGEEEPQISNTASVAIGDADAVDTNTVVSLVEPEEEPAPVKKTTAPKTGDVAGVLLFVLFASCGFVVVTTSRRRKKRVRA